jgi:hypothetical protein
LLRSLRAAKRSEGAEFSVGRLADNPANLHQNAICTGANVTTIRTSGPQEVQ